MTLSLASHGLQVCHSLCKMTMLHQYVVVQGIFIKKYLEVRSAEVSYGYVILRLDGIYISNYKIIVAVVIMGCRARSKV